jgi:hypothetical protein
VCYPIPAFRGVLSHTYRGYLFSGPVFLSLIFRVVDYCFRVSGYCWCLLPSGPFSSSDIRVPVWLIVVFRCAVLVGYTSTRTRYTVFLEIRLIVGLLSWLIVEYPYRFRAIVVGPFCHRRFFGVNSVDCCHYF